MADTIIKEKETDNKASNAGPIVAVVAIVVILLVGLLAFGVFGGNDSGPDTINVETPTPSSTTAQ